MAFSLKYIRFTSQFGLFCAAACFPLLRFAAELIEVTDIRFAFYSSGWGANTDDGMRLVVFNQTENQLRLDSMFFLKNEQQAESVKIDINLTIPPLGFADKEFEYIDLLQGNECISRTLEEDWKLVEVSNYTLNPSVRNLIIENTDSFRIYQCVESVQTTWTNVKTEFQMEFTEWVLFHFETRRNN